MSDPIETHDCTWPDEYDPWRCPNAMYEVVAGQEADHYCAASEGHPGNHCCIHGTRWSQPKPRRCWRDRLLRRQR